jgi:predicted RNase H-like HicB family nuclease
MNDEISQLLKRKYVTIIRLEENTEGGYCYVAFHPELPGCMSQGETPEEAKNNLREATEMVIKHLLLHHLHVPEPTLLTSSFPSRLYGRIAEPELQPAFQP